MTEKIKNLIKNNIIKLLYIIFILMSLLLIASRLISSGFSPAHLDAFNNPNNAKYIEEPVIIDNDEISNYQLLNKIGILYSNKTNYTFEEASSESLKDKWITYTKNDSTYFYSDFWVKMVIKKDVASNIFLQIGTYDFSKKLYYIIPEEALIYIGNADNEYIRKTVYGRSYEQFEIKNRRFLLDINSDTLQCYNVYIHLKNINPYFSLFSRKGLQKVDYYYGILIGIFYGTIIISSILLTLFSFNFKSYYYILYSIGIVLLSINTMIFDFIFFELIFKSFPIKYSFILTRVIFLSSTIIMGVFYIKFIKLDKYLCEVFKFLKTYIIIIIISTIYVLILEIIYINTAHPVIHYIEMVSDFKYLPSIYAIFICIISCFYLFSKGVKNALSVIFSVFFITLFYILSFIFDIIIIDASNKYFFYNILIRTAFVTNFVFIIYTIFNDTVKIKKQKEKEFFYLSGKIHNSIKNKLEATQMVLPDIINCIEDKYYKDKLSVIKNIIQRCSYDCKNILFIINNRICSVNSLFHELELRAKLLFSLSKIKYKITKNTISNDYQIELAKLFNILEIYDELLNNIFKHSQATEIYIKVELTIYDETNNQLLIQIIDNGIVYDFDAEKQKQDTYGIKLIEKFSEEIKAELKISSNSLFNISSLKVIL